MVFLNLYFIITLLRSLLRHFFPSHLSSHEILISQIYCISAICCSAWRGASSCTKIFFPHELVFTPMGPVLPMLRIHNLEVASSWKRAVTIFVPFFTNWNWNKDTISKQLMFKSLLIPWPAAAGEEWKEYFSHISCPVWRRYFEQPLDHFRKE